MSAFRASQSRTEFIAGAYLGKIGWKYAVVALVILLVSWFIGNLVYYSIKSSIYEKFDYNASTYILQLVFLCSSTGLLWIGMSFVAKFVLRRNIKTFISSSENLNFKFFVFGAVVFLLARLIDLFVLFAVGATIGVPSIRSPDFVVTPVFSLYSAAYVVVLIFQSAIEEITARGFFMQSIFAIVKNKFVSATISSAMFVALHPGSDFVFASTMFAASMWMAALCLVSNGLEMSIGFHFSNNVGAYFASVFFGGSYLNMNAPAGSEWSLFIVYVLAAAATFAIVPMRRNLQRNE
ncbi:CPBP family intramembrane glutamic endopeptidase [Burkholderia pseudomallei]|uniref:CPBP family intramembrane glutamic endopeptidase n=1 Tax=Burkholderia pseudomallei TaxID=28450 RepID=UPI0018DC2A2B|nr:CPBP family intramembrane glutamic endopeptidase [Burkholderia pseudomallei]